MKAGALTGTGGAGTQPGTGSDAWRSVDDGHLHLERSMDRIPGLEAGDVLDGHREILPRRAAHEGET